MIGQSMEKMAESVGQAFKSIVATGPSSTTPVLNPDSSPQRLTSAIQRAQNLETGWLTAAQFQDLLNLFESNRTASMMYLALQPDRVDKRRAWIRRKLSIVSSDFED